MDVAPANEALEARRLAERGLHEQAVGNIGEADRLLAQAQELDPDAVADVLREHDAGRAPDARLQDLADHARACADVEATTRSRRRRSKSRPIMSTASR